MSNIRQIILIHPKKFVCRSFEAFAKKADFSIYTLESPVDFSYLVEELRPDMVLIHEDLLLDDNKSYFEQMSLSSFKDFKEVLIRGNEMRSNSETNSRFKLFLDEPYDLGDLSNILTHLLAEHH